MRDTFEKLALAGIILTVLWIIIWSFGYVLFGWIPPVHSQDGLVYLTYFCLSSLGVAYACLRLSR